MPVTEITCLVELEEKQQKCYDGIFANALAAFLEYNELDGRDRFKFAYKLVGVVATFEASCHALGIVAWKRRNDPVCPAWIVFDVPLGLFLML